MKRRRYWLIPVFALLLGLAFAYVLLNRLDLLTGLRPSQPTQLAISAPSAGQGVALHSTISVVGEANSSVGVRSLELWVNSQKWGDASFDVPQTQVHQVWAWTPSGEGKHVLLLRAVDSLGQTLEAEVITVYASAQFDVHFPLPYTTTGGETLSGLAAAFATDPQSVAESNPGYGPNAPLPSGQQLTIPVPVPNSDPVAPAGGQQAVPPAGPIPEGIPGGVGDSGAPASGGQGGAIDLKYPVQQIYAYVSVAGQPWFKIPEGVFTFLPSSGSTFDISPHLKPEMLAGLPSPISFYAQVWGWSGGQLVYLGDQSGVLEPALQQARAFTSTSLAIIGRINDSVSYESEWNIPLPIPGYYAGYNQGFRWTAAIPGVSGGHYQVSMEPFQPGATWLIPGLVDVGKLPPPQTGIVWADWSSPIEYVLQPVDFSIDFSKYLALPGKNPVADFFEDPFGALKTPSGKKLWNGDLPTTFYVRIFPILGGKLGEPSNTVIVHYGAPPPQPVTAETGPLYDVQLLSSTNFRAADPAYKACRISTRDYYMCYSTHSADGSTATGQVCNQLIPKGTLSCGCPGIPCPSKKSSCWGDFNLANCMAEGAGQVGNLMSWVSGKFSELKGLAVEAIMKYTGMQDVCAAFGTADECRGAVTAAVDYGLASMGVPPSIPDFEKLMTEGEEYLIELAVQEARDLGVPCEDDGVCEGAVKAGIDELIKAASPAGSSSGSGAASGGQGFVPHELANEQPAIMKFLVTRRPETAGIPLEHTASCSLMVWNTAANTLYGVKLEGAPFIGVSMDIPPMEPGDSVIIPVVFKRMAWSPPKGLTLKTASGQSITPPIESGYGSWQLLYYGSTVTFDVRSQAFETPGADGKKVSVSCMENFNHQEQIPVP